NCQDKNNNDNIPEFYILGRVRRRMGFHWKPAFALRKLRHQSYAACPKCGEVVRDAVDDWMEAHRFPTDKRRQCGACHEPLCSLSHAHEGSESKKSVSLKEMLCKLPTIGNKRAEWLLQHFGEAFISNMLGDNIHQFINLMDENGEMVFSDAQALRME